ncbi:flagellar filament capping protein FliD [Janthinobacterium agaricidamnosum]|uniref:Flagellar hook-associated protein 2 n=1 Tax=Janthinobacterium agaricidamnosum NBRC 102515 = DSM 9628 TaxID=1349767 RepID=W0V3V6_9BURK|nr:flagellar filament capping protein FliD [Janthinobacterium agaricidamnosum]CDG82561.1 flagellar hook-associated 2 C-terminus family protein [Janthinobacterium agaricidamnosum NBRC 102515 = DSM 9628]
MTSITSPVYDPVDTAKKLAALSVQAQVDALKAKTDLATKTDKALNDLKSAMATFQAAMTAMSKNKSVLSQSATFGNTAYGSATAGVTAAPGTYSFFVEQLATASQTSYGGLGSSPAAGSGTLTVKIGDGTGNNRFDIDLSAADKNGDGTLTPQEIAAAINASSKNNSRVTASIVTVDNQAQLVLTSNSTGAANAVSLDASGVTNSALTKALVTDAATNIKQVVQARDAVVWLGAKGTGTRIQQASNTFTNLQDVKITFTKAMADGDAPVTLAVATDSTATTANVQAFVDAYNKLKTTLDTLTSPGKPEKGVAPGIFYSDSGMASLRNSIGQLLRQNVGGVSLVDYGITSARDGSLTLDAGKLTARLANSPGNLDSLFGNNTIGRQTGVLGSLDKLMNQWSSDTQGQITQRLAGNAKLQKEYGQTSDHLDDVYESNRLRYLDQFTRLQVLQANMQKTLDMFDAMFGSNKS